MLIPVLPGLDQKQLEDLLPKILKQTPNVVKEAFKRILSPYRAGGSGKLQEVIVSRYMTSHLVT